MPAEAIAQRAGDEARPGGGADQREGRQVEAQRAGGGTLAQHDVELVVLHRRVEDLLHRAGQAVDLVDEQHVALFELGQHSGDVPGPLEGGPGGDVHGDAQLVGHDAGQRGLAEAGWAGEEEVVDGLATPAGRLQHDVEVVLQLGLPDEVGQPPGT